MFSGIRSLIFGAYEEDSGLSTVQPKIKAAHLLPSLEDQQKEEEERLLRESQSIANDGQNDSLHKLQDSTNSAEDAWELIDFDEEDSSCQKKIASEEKSQEHKQERHLEPSTKVTNDGGNSEANANFEMEKNVVDSDLVVVAQQVNNNETLIVTDTVKNTKGRGQSQNNKEVGRLSSPTTTTTTTNTTTTTTVTKPTPSKFSTDVVEYSDSKQIVKSNGIPVYVRPTISFAAVAAKNSSPIVACGTSLKQSSCVVAPMMKSNELSSTILATGKNPTGAGLKRQRPMSTSSWSSQSDFNDPIIVDSDDESIASSDFSDCDYDHGYNHDQLMKESKPKQSNKHRRDYAMSKSLSVGEKLASSDGSSKNGLQEHVIQKQNLIKSSGKSSGKNTRFAKSKKKKSTLDTVQEPCSGKTKNNINKSKIIQVIKAQQCMGPPPPPPPPTTNNSSGNDSSDAAEMDESWFVTPPSCFDGCKSPKKVLRKNVQKHAELVRTSDAGDSNLNYQKSFRSGLSKIVDEKNLSPESTDLNHRSSSSTELENLLIEHPSMYIQRANKQNQKPMSNQKVPEVKTNQISNTVDAVSEKNVCKSKDAKSVDMTKTMQKVVTSAKGKGNKTLPKDISNPDVGIFSHENAKTTRHETAMNGQSSIHTSVTLLSARPLSSASSSPSPFSSDNEDNLEDMDLYKPMTTDLDRKPYDDASIASTKDSQTKDSKLVKDEESKENNNIANRAAVRVLPAVQLIDDHLPYWQKKKKRPQRRSQVGGQKTVSNSCSPSSGKNSPCSSASDYSDCSVPSLISSSSAGIINRIGSSIVANITNLTTSLPNVQHVRGIAEEMRKFAENVDNGSQRFPNEHSLIVQRKLAKSHMTKQNKRLASDTGNRRVGRKTKMFARANGYSIDRKVQKNFH